MMLIPVSLMIVILLAHLISAFTLDRRIEYKIGLNPRSLEFTGFHRFSPIFFTIMGCQDMVTEICKIFMYFLTKYPLPI